MATSTKELRAPPSSAAPGSDANRQTATDNAVPAVRFSSAVEEISPTATLKDASATDPSAAGNPAADDQPSVFTEVAQDQLRKSLQKGSLQEHRMNMNGFQFEAFSLPPSRVPSRDESSPDSSRRHTPTSSALQSPHGSPRLSALASPPLTPSGSGGADKKLGSQHRLSGSHDVAAITPQPSTSQEKSPAAQQRQPLAHRPASSDHIMRRSSSVEERLGAHQSHRRGMLSQGGGSVPVSRESSPSRSSASHYYSKPMTPVGDVNDPYAKGRRAPAVQPHPNRHSIDPRFVFSRKKKHGSPGGSTSSLAGTGAFAKNGDDSDSNKSHHHHHAGHGSMADLKRFFRKNGHHQKKREASPARSVKAQTPPPSRSSHQVPFADDHGLTSKYGKLGKVLGAGAGGSVRLMRRREDGTVFAVKEFRARHTYETEKEYNKKVTAEFCVGSTLHHGNIIETLDILQEKGRWFEVMEYAPFDLFAIVMTGKMSREEVSCCFLQILNGVTYLHSLGLAHRDLKLDNVVVSDRGIMKIIDFGSAHVFKYPFESLPVLAKGIVGSDPYLAPEVYDQREYDAAAVDIWSLAIIYCCMSLRRFPWKIPRMTDNSFKLFAADPTPGHDPNKLIVASRSTGDLSSTVARDFLTGDEGKKERHHHRQPSEGHKKDDTPTATPTTTGGTGITSGTATPTGEKKEVIRGPWRILRLLPRESRHIIHRMLDMNPKTRAKMDEILEEPWVADSVICQQLENGDVLSAEDHTHVLEPPNNPQ